MNNAKQSKTEPAVKISFDFYCVLLFIYLFILTS